MIKASNSNTHSKGFILFPIMIMLMSASLILITLTQEFYTHIRLTKETQLYFNATQQAKAIIPTLETNLSLSIDSTKTATPEDQATLLNHLSTWPQLNENISSYTQLIHQQKQNLYYSSLIGIKDNQAQPRAIFELLSFCTLADHHCRPVELTLMQ